MELEGESRETAASALRSSRRMRRLVADLLLLARADSGRAGSARAARPLRGRHRGGRRARARGRRSPDQRQRARRRARWRARATSCTGSRSTCWRTRCATPIPGTAVEATVERRNGEVVLSVEDDGPGIPPGAARQGLRALLPRRRRPQRVERPRPLDRARGRGLALRAPCRSRSRWTAAARASSCGSPRADSTIRPDGAGAERPTSETFERPATGRLRDQPESGASAVGALPPDTAHQCDSHDGSRLIGGRPNSLREPAGHLDGCPTVDTRPTPIPSVSSGHERANLRQGVRAPEQREGTDIMGWQR